MQGTASIADGVQAQFDLALLPEGFDLRRLALRDADTDASLRLHWSPVGAQLGFNGRLHHRTLERSLARPPTDACHARWKLPRIHRPRAATPLER